MSGWAASGAAVDGFAVMRVGIGTRSTLRAVRPFRRVQRSTVSRVGCAGREPGACASAASSAPQPAYQSLVHGPERGPLGRPAFEEPVTGRYPRQEVIARRDGGRAARPEGAMA